MADQYDDIGGMLSKLQEPFSTIRQRKGAGGRQFDYLSGSDVLGRMLEVNPTWDWRVIDWKETNTYKSVYTDQSTGEVRGGYAEPIPTLMVVGELTIPGLGTRAGMGVATIEPGKGEDNLKGAETDAFKRAAVKFGVGFAQLYGDADPVEASYQQSSQPSRQTSQPAQGGQQRQGQSTTGPGGVRGYAASDGQVKFVRDLMRDLDLKPDDLFARFGPQGQYRTDKGEVVLPVLVKTAEELKSWQARAIIEHLKTEKEERGTTGQTGTMR